MTSVLDVAKYILKKHGPMSAMKLQKLCYYSQAWSLVWDDGKPLFSEDIQAWAFGPVVPELYEHHRGQVRIASSDIPKTGSRGLTSKQRENVDAVLESYGDKPAHWLSQLTHREKPWKKARGGLPSGAQSSTVISLRSMQEYYDSLIDGVPVRDLES